MLGLSAFGQFALGQTSAEYVIPPQYIIDDSASPERRKRRRKQQEDAVAEIVASKERLRGTIYDAIHPPEIFTPLDFNPGLLGIQSYPVISPNDPMVGAIMTARMSEKRRQQMLLDMQDEDDIEMLLRGQ